MINILFAMPEFAVESKENCGWNLAVNGYRGRLYAVCGGPELLSIALPFAVREPVSALLRWNHQLAVGEWPVECALLWQAQQWWLAQQFIEIPADAEQRVRWQIRLADCLLLLNRQRQRVSQHISEEWQR